jgi:hypothetical protein
MVNDNSFILSLLLFLSPILFSNVCIIVLIDLFCAGSTHLHGIRVDELLSKIYTKIFLQVLKIEEHRKMESMFYSSTILLTPHNYLEWKTKIMLHIRCRGLYQITMAMKVELDSTDEKTNFLNRQDMAIGFIFFSISPKILDQVCDVTQEFNPN